MIIIIIIIIIIINNNNGYNGYINVDSKGLKFSCNNYSNVL